jgi:tight adherence protein B
VVGARDVQVVITQVAGLVRSGMPPDRAWAGVGVTVRPDGIPTPADLLHLTSDAAQARAVVAACRLAQQVGAPIAPVLDSIVATLVAAAESAAERDTALASPRSTARLLLWLPAAGAVVATVLGAGPVQLLLGGGPAVLAPVAGGLLLAVGRWWTRRLVQAAVGDHPAG